MKEGRAVNCPVKGCKRVFQIMSSFTSHMSRKHRNYSFDINDHSHQHSAPEISSVSTEQCPTASDLDANADPVGVPDCDLLLHQAPRLLLDSTRYQALQILSPSELRVELPPRTQFSTDSLAERAPGRAASPDPVLYRFFPVARRGSSVCAFYQTVVELLTYQ
ncbi:uncharacterized protein LOC130424950 [Triplophysa dalaica]|uniref:uncharacterized protein LOC130424950 n=1 Tax=Triplophysa dalaica TaxID=1582913 RepID=UPI0024DF86D0|nr:uncharacterized protein LOC130424950 [Triplophysa dalaica]